MIQLAIVLAIIAAIIDYFFKIAEPWRKLVWIGVVVLLVWGIVTLLVPGLFPLHLGSW